MTHMHIVLWCLAVSSEKAEQDGTNVLVHWYVQMRTLLLYSIALCLANRVLLLCSIAGRSRSASVVAAWMLLNEPKLLTVQDAVDRVRCYLHGSLWLRTYVCTLS